MGSSADSGRRRLSAEERRELILAGAMEVMAERGYDGASMSEIARAAGITPAVIYDHFPSKAELQIELLERQTAELIGFVAAALAAASPGLEERLRAGIDAYFQFVEEHRFAWRVMIREPPSDRDVAAAWTRANRQATEAIAGFIRSGAPDAVESEPDPQKAAIMFAEMLKMAQNGLATWWYENPEVPREEIVARLMDFCWIGMERVAAGERTPGGSAG